MLIFLASDHAGLGLKIAIKDYLKGLGFKVEDEGAYEYREDDDYPDYVRMAALQVAGNPEEDRAIVIGGSCQGEAMVANRVRGVRAAVYYGGQPGMPRLTREHNNSNVLALGARFLSEEEAKQVVMEWLQTPFSNEERHIRRIAKIDELISDDHEL